MLTVCDRMGIDILQILTTIIIVCYSAWIFNIVYLIPLWGLFTIMLVGYLGIRWIEDEIVNKRGFSVNNSLFLNVFLFLIQWFCILYITSFFWISTEIIWWLYVPNILFVYWIIIITFVVAKTYRCDEQSE